MTMQNNPNFFGERREKIEQEIVDRNKRVGDRAAYGNFVQNWNAALDDQDTYEKRVARKEELRGKDRDEAEQQEFEELLSAIEIWQKQMAETDKKNASTEEARFEQIQSLGDKNSEIGNTTLPL